MTASASNINPSVMPFGYQTIAGRNPNAIPTGTGISTAGIQTRPDLYSGFDPGSFDLTTPVRTSEVLGNKLNAKG